MPGPTGEIAAGAHDEGRVVVQSGGIKYHSHVVQHPVRLKGGALSYLRIARPAASE